MNSTPIRVGIIGCGAALEHLYLHPLRRLANKGWISLIGLAEPGAKRQAWARSAFPGARVVADAKELFVGGGVDLTIITSPPPFHAPHASLALAAGSHVLCEKPLADTIAAGRDMIAAAERAQRRLAVGMTRRFYPCLEAARRYIAACKLGKILSYSYVEGGVYAWPVTSDAPFRRATSGGGVLLDKGVHVLDLLWWLFGKAELVASHDDALVDGVEANSVVRLRHGTVQGYVQLSWDQDLNSGLVIRGEAGEMWIPVGPLHDLFFRVPGQRWERLECDADWPADLERTGGARGGARIYYECFDFQLIQILRALVHGERVPVDATEGLDVLQLIERAYATAAPLQQPWLSAQEQASMNRDHWRATK